MPGVTLPIAAFGTPANGTIGIDENGDLVFQKAGATKYVLQSTTPTPAAFDSLSTLVNAPSLKTATTLLVDADYGKWIDVDFAADGMIVLPPPNNGKQIGIRFKRKAPTAGFQGIKAIIRPSTQFTTGGPSAVVYAVAVQPDGKVLLGGNFGSYTGVSRAYLVRLNADGTLDTSFNTAIGTLTASVNAICLDSSGNIFITHSTTVKKFSSSGTPDATFNAAVGVATGESPSALVALSDGSLIIGGGFSAWAAGAANGIAKVSSAGVLDTTFQTNVGTGVSSNDNVFCLARNSSDDIFVGGDFTAINGTTRNRFAKLSSAGVVDATFYTNLGSGAFNGPVTGVAVQTDGEILCVGSYSQLGGVTRTKFVRLNTDGTIDTAHYTASGGSSLTGSIFVALDASDNAYLVGHRIMPLGGNFTVGTAEKHDSTGAPVSGFPDSPSLLRFYQVDAGGTTNMYGCDVDANGHLVVVGDFTALGNSGYCVPYVYRIPKTGFRFVTMTLLPGNQVTLRSTADDYEVTSAYLDTDPCTPGEVAFTAVTTAPTKGSTSTWDKMTWSRQGSMIHVTYEYRHITAGTAGSGTYLMPLPYALNKQLHDSRAATVDLMQTIIGNGSVNGYQMAVGAYDVNNAYAEEATGGLWSSTYLPFSSTALWCAFRLDYYVLDW